MICLCLFFDIFKNKNKKQTNKQTNKQKSLNKQKSKNKQTNKIKIKQPLNWIPSARPASIISLWMISLWKIALSILPRLSLIWSRWWSISTSMPLVRTQQNMKSSTYTVPVPVAVDTGHSICIVKEWMCTLFINKWAELFLKSMSILIISLQKKS